VIKGIRLGSNISDFSNLVFIGDVGGKKVYRVEGKKAKITDADVEIITYGFYSSSTVI